MFHDMSFFILCYSLLLLIISHRVVWNISIFKMYILLTLEFTLLYKNFLCWRQCKYTVGNNMAFGGHIVYLWPAW